MAPATRSGEDSARTRRARMMPWLLGAIVLTVVTTALAVLADPVSGGRVEVMDLMSDPTEVLGTPWYVGGVSALSLMVWAASTSLFLVEALVWLGALTAVVAVDDRFVLHEIVLPHLTGLPQTTFYAAYAAAAGAILLRHGRVLLAQAERVLLVVASDDQRTARSA